MLKTYYEKLHLQLEEELSLFSELGTLPVRRLTGALNCVSEALTKLKDFLIEHPLNDQLEEINFFKHEKPRFVSEKLYALEIFTIETNRPVGDSLALKKFYEQELQFIKRFFTQYQFLYQYYKFELKELDQLLFVRGAKISDNLLPETFDPDPQFSTGCDYLFAKFMAYERLQSYIADELISLENPVKLANVDIKESFIQLKWTGETINLVELAYGIWLTGQINNGNASITEIIQWLEVHFQVNIGRAYRRWQSISKRKRVKPTKYIDEVRDAILKRLDEENGMK